MYWKNVDHHYHHRKAKVWADSTPDNPENGVPPTIGHIDCREEGSVPFLRVGTQVHSFASWYQVELLD